MPVNPSSENCREIKSQSLCIWRFPEITERLFSAPYSCCESAYTYQDNNETNKLTNLVIEWINKWVTRKVRSTWQALLGVTGMLYRRFVGLLVCLVIMKIGDANGRWSTNGSLAVLMNVTSQWYERCMQKQHKSLCSLTESETVHLLLQRTVNGRRRVGLICFCMKL